MPSRKPEIFELTEACATEEEILESPDLGRFLQTFNMDVAGTIESIKEDPNEALRAYFQLRKFRGIVAAPNASAIEFQKTLNLLLVEKIIKQGDKVKFNAEYLPFFTENSRIFMNRGYLPVTVHEGNITSPIYPADDLNSQNNCKDGYIELRRLPNGIKYTNYAKKPDPKEILAKAETKDGLGFSAENECSHAVFATVTYDRTKKSDGKEVIGPDGTNILSSERIIDESVTWSDDVVAPRGEISSQLLEQNRQYGVALFEGIGVEKDEDGNVQIFRLDEHAERMSKGGQFFDMPPIPPELFKKMVIECVQANKEYIPENGKGRLYVRPDWFDKGPRLHVNNSNLHALTMTAVVIGSMESYFQKGEKTFFVPQNSFRAVENGAGQTKAVGNYASTIRMNHRSTEAGMAGILYMNEGKTRIEETLASSFIRIIRRNGKIVLQTPKLDYGTILDSITRKSLLTLAKNELGWDVEETDISPDDAFMPNDDIEILGYYAAGTAAGLAPIHGIRVGSFNNESGEIENLDEVIQITKYDEQNPAGIEGKQLIDLLLASKNGTLIKTKMGKMASMGDTPERKKMDAQIQTYKSWLQAA